VPSTRIDFWGIGPTDLDDPLALVLISLLV
jgi:hypothetical protein